ALFLFRSGLAETRRLLLPSLAGRTTAPARPSCTSAQCSEMLRSVFALSLLSSFLIIVYQRLHINNLQHELSSFSCSHRAKRSISVDRVEEDEDGDEHSVSFPLFAKISKKAMRKLCEEDRKGRTRKERRKKESGKRREEEKRRKSEGQGERRMERKRCSPHATFSPPRLVARRSHWSGCALRDGSTWFLCEFHMGYTMLEYADTPSLSASLPKTLITLPFPYDGTDGAAINGSVAYAHDDQVVLHNFATSQTSRLPVALNRAPIYNGSFSRMDIQSDEHGLWILYREQEKQTLTVARVAVPSLKLLQTWQLALDPSRFCNAFIRCGILHSILCTSSEATIQPAYDFYSAQSIVGKTTRLPGIKEEINSAQFDPVSHTLSIYTRGLIYSVAIEETSPSSV
ncbi:hypothetical protein PMAYCL1PPCAC_04826, partial [Pristionchus mayeri]